MTNEQADSDCTLDYFMDDVIIAGDPEHVTHQLLELREQIGPFGTLVLTAHDWDDRDRWTHSLELFAAKSCRRSTSNLNFKGVILDQHTHQ